MYEMQNAVQSNQLNQMKMDEYKRGLAETESWKQSMSGVDASTPQGQQTIYNGLLRLGKVDEAAKFAKGIAETANLGLTGKETEGKVAKQKQDFISQAFRNISQNPSDQNVIAWGQDAVLNKHFTLEEANGIVNTLLSQPAEQRSAFLASQGASASDLKPHIQTQGLGNRSVVSAYPAFGGAPTQLSSSTIGQSPDSVASNERIASEGRLNREAKLKAEIDSGVTGLSPESLDFTAQLYMQTGMLPPLGMGAKAATLRKQIIERAAQLSMHPETAGAVNPAAPGATTPPVAPPVSAADAAGNVTQNKQNVAVAVKTLKDFSTGVQGQMVTSFNTALNHLDTLERLGNDLNNSDIKVVNSAANLFAKELGVAAPTSFDAAKKIVGAEIQKAIVRAGGTGSEREEAAAAFDAANSPAQLAGVFSSVRELLGGQLVSLKQQYDSNAGPKAKPFANKLNSAARKQLEALTGGKTSATSAPAQAPAAKTTLPLKNKQGWILHTDADGNKAYVSSDGQIKEVK
jgi:hypothetical protein